MNRKQIRTIVKKELKELKNDKAVIAVMIVVPLVLLVAMPLVVLLLGMDERAMQQLVPSLKVVITNMVNYAPTTISPEKLPIYAIYRYLLPPLMLLIPVMISNMIASNGFIGEKEKRTIEALLYTPISKRTLIMGKTLAALVPAILITWLFSIIYSIIANVAGHFLLNQLLFPNIEWLLMILFVVPAITFLSIVLVILISQRMKTSKSAQAVSMFLVLPIMGMVITQAIGAIFIDAWMLLLIFIILVIFDIIIFSIAAKKFNTEKYILSM